MILQIGTTIAVQWELVSIKSRLFGKTWQVHEEETPCVM